MLIYVVKKKHAKTCYTTQTQQTSMQHTVHIMASIMTITSDTRHQFKTGHENDDTVMAWLCQSYDATCKCYVQLSVAPAQNKALGDQVGKSFGTFVYFILDLFNPAFWFKPEHV